MFSVNFVKPSAVVFDTEADDIRPCRNRNCDWEYRMKHNFTGEVYSVDVHREKVGMLFEIQCTYVDMNTPGAQDEVRNAGYADIIDAINNSGTHIEKLCIIDNIVIVPSAPIGELRFAMQRLHCIVCQLMSLGYGEHCYFGWVMDFRHMLKEVAETTKFFMTEYKTGDIVQDYLLESVPYFHRIPWDPEKEAENYKYEGKTWNEMSDDERKECMAMAKAGKCATDALK